MSENIERLGELQVEDTSSTSEQVGEPAPAVEPKVMSAPSIATEDDLWEANAPVIEVTPAPLPSVGNSQIVVPLASTPRTKKWARRVEDLPRAERWKRRLPQVCR